MEFFNLKTSFDFMKAARFWVPFSMGLVAVSLVLVVAVGFDSGIDFKGGTKIIVEFKKDAKIERSAIKKVVDELVQKQTGEKGTQVEVQDFDVGAAAQADTRKYQVFTELPSLLTPLRKLELAKDLEKHFGAGSNVELPSDAGDKFYVSLPEDWPLDAARKEIAGVFQKAGYVNVRTESDKEDRITSEMLREKDLLMSAKDQEVQAEATKVEDAAKKRIAGLSDNRFTVEVQAIKDQLTEGLKANFGDGFVSVLSTASVSPSVGKELFQTAMLSMFYALIGILIYIALRFDLKFAPGAIICLFHDVAVLFGLMAVLDVKFTLTIVAAIMTIIGYDINDTIVVYDRIRENIQKGRAGDMAKIINTSINETLGRTLMTSMGVLMAALVMFFMGGATIKDFALLLFVGVVLGTYSSIFVAAPMTMWLDRIFRRKSPRAQTAKA